MEILLTDFSNKDGETISEIIYNALCDKGIPFDTDDNNFKYKIVVNIIEGLDQPLFYYIIYGISYIQDRRRR